MEAQNKFEEARINMLPYFENGICQNNSIMTPVDENIQLIVGTLNRMESLAYLFQSMYNDVYLILQRTQTVLSSEVHEVIDMIEKYSDISWVLVFVLIISMMLLYRQLLLWCCSK